MPALPAAQLPTELVSVRHVQDLDFLEQPQQIPRVGKGEVQDFQLCDEFLLLGEVPLAQRDPRFGLRQMLLASGSLHSSR
ncbi:hypothetical protein ACNHKD_02755 [Methylocystis sp. JAN1]|uniref:hypothetical protein n=1 Tax=Methylocystis sp. JAN1 TaxID=3397211 RepID=UPI003FA2F280